MTDFSHKKFRQLFQLKSPNKAFLSEKVKFPNVKMGIKAIKSQITNLRHRLKINRGCYNN